MKEQYFYRKYIKGVVSKANKEKYSEFNNIVYKELVKWLKIQEIKLEQEMFKAVLATSRKVAEEYINSGDIKINETSNLYSMLFHTFTNKDGVHTDSAILKRYLNDFFPVLKKRIDEEKLLGDRDLRYRKFDVVSMGKLFDNILKCVDENTEVQIAKMMDEFVKNDLE